MWHGVPAAVDHSNVICGCPPGTNQVIAPAGQWLGRDPKSVAREKHDVMLVAQRETEEKRREEEQDRKRVFAKSCLRGEGCTDAGNQREPHTNFAEMAFFQAMPADEPHHEDMNYQTAVLVAASTQRVQAARAGVNVLRPLAGSIRIGGTWAARASIIATAGAGASVAGLLAGMMPGRLNDGEQDFIDRMRAEQMQEAPTRVRFTWENDANGNSTPRGWHTPPGQDMVRVRKMEWDSVYQAYTFTTDEAPRITLTWTPDASGNNKLWNTGNPSPPQIPGTIIVDPLPSDTSIRSTSNPEPEEKNFADYILILPVADIPPIYIYISTDHKYHAAPKGTPPLPAFPDAKTAKKRTPVKGGGSLRSRWKDSKGRIYEWDSQHGTVEIYDRSGRNHLGEFDPTTGEQTKPADPTRKVEK